MEKKQEMNIEPIKPITFPKAKEYPKAWGQNGIGEIWITNNDKYCFKILKFAKGKSFSTHLHYIKHEHFLIGDDSEFLMQYYDLTNGDLLEKRLFPNDIVEIPAGNPHKLTAIKDSILYEVSSTHFEFDSYRIGKGDSQIKK
jgi:mannose-6-phosphate isomerase-like protein (cupin superfamily)